jgi:hypothetical protein
VKGGSGRGGKRVGGVGRFGEGEGRGGKDGSEEFVDRSAEELVRR